MVNIFPYLMWENHYFSLIQYAVALYILVKRRIYVIKTVSPEVIRHRMALN